MEDTQPNLNGETGSSVEFSIQEKEAILKGTRSWASMYKQLEDNNWGDMNTVDAENLETMVMVEYRFTTSLMWGELDRIFLQAEDGTPEDNTKAQENSKKLSNLIRDGTPQEREDLICFLRYDLWLSWRHVILSSEGGREPYPDFLEEFDRKMSLISPLLSETAAQSTNDNSTHEIKLIFEGYRNVDARKEAENLVLREDIDDATRLRLAVGYINTFGFINAVDLVATEMKMPGLSDKYRQKLNALYIGIQGEEAERVSAKLTEIYQRIDFNAYQLNTSELTEEEVSQIEDFVKQFETLDEGSTILDIGAGSGRHVQALISHGYTKVIAFDYEAKHIDKIRKLGLDIPTIQGDWDRLYDLVQINTGNAGKIDFAYCLGRSITHNRTPNEMVHMFDEVKRSLSKDGVFLFDMADINWGTYQDMVSRLKTNLENIGVEELQTQLIFDGPSSAERFNRMLLRPDQVKSMANLFGYKLITNRHVSMDNGKISNAYYYLQKDETWDPSSITPEDFNENIRNLGLLEPGTDFGMYVESWGMTLGQALIYIHQFGLGNEYMRILNESGLGPTVNIEHNGSKMNLESSGFNMRSYHNAIASRGLSREEVEQRYFVKSKVAPR